jgi:site-specific DNA-cytosine methylase
VLNTHNFDVPQSRNKLIFVGFRGTAVPVQYFHELAAFSCPGQTCGEAIRDIGRAGTPSNPATCNAKIKVCKDPVLRESTYAGMLFNGSGRPLDPTRPCLTLPASMGGNATPIIDEEQFFGAGGNSFENLHAALVERNERVAQELTPELTSVLTRAANRHAHRTKIKCKLRVSAAAADRIYGLVAEREPPESNDCGPQTQRRLESVWASRATLLDAYAVAWVAPESVRRLTVTEAARLQTFPHDYAFQGGIHAAYRQIGNAVPCNFTYALARAVAKVLRDAAPTPVAADGALRARRPRSRSPRRSQPASSGA